MRKSTLFIGLDESKDSIAVAIAVPGHRGRDAVTLARLHRAGELTPVWIPDTASEAMRDLTRSREDAKYAQTQAPQRLGSFLLRHGRHYPGRSHRTATYLNGSSGPRIGENPRVAYVRRNTNRYQGGSRWPAVFRNRAGETRGSETRSPREPDSKEEP